MTEDQRSVGVFYSLIPDSLDGSIIEQLSSLLSEDEQLRLGFLTRPKPRLHFLFGRLLLRRAFTRMGFPAFPALSFSESGKPHLADHPDFGISLSHSGSLVACAMASGAQTGIDVQETVAVDLENYQPSFQPQEWDFIRHESDPQLAFYRLWTRKEAVTKADGAGLGIPFESFDVLADTIPIDDNTWQWADLELPEGYCGALACSNPSNLKNLVLEQTDLMDSFK